MKNEPRNLLFGTTNEKGAKVNPRITHPVQKKHAMTPVGFMTQSWSGGAGNHRSVQDCVMKERQERLAVIQIRPGQGRARELKTRELAFQGFRSADRALHDGVNADHVGEHGVKVR